MRAAITQLIKGMIKVRGYAVKRLLLFCVIIVLLLTQMAVAFYIETGSVDSAPNDGRMLLFWDGGATPTGWTCVSCASGDPFYQIFPRGADSYGGAGGAATHTHAAVAAIGQTASTASQAATGSTISDVTHAHTASLAIVPVSNLPQYRQLQIIRSDTQGQPNQIPAGAIGLFDGALPSGWGSYSAQDGYYLYGSDAAGLTGGNNTHSHGLSGSVNAAMGTAHGSANGNQRPSAPAGHTHTYSGTTASQNHEPPYVEVVLGKLSITSSPPDGLIAMWDDDVPTNWTKQSGASGAFYQKFLKGAASFGAVGGGISHAHVDVSLTSSAPIQAPINSKSGSVTASSTHTHQVTIAGISAEEHLPPYRDVIIGKKVPQSAFEQSAFRFYGNTDSADVGTPLAGLNSAASTPPTGTPFRLRTLLHISAADFAAGNKNFKLQYANRSGTCDTSFSGETYTDISAGSGLIRYYDNVAVSDGTILTVNTNDPAHGLDTIVGQTYEELNNFTSTSNVAIGEDAMWDFSLVDYSSSPSSSYCFRIVESDGSLLDSYSVIPEILTDDGAGHMLIFYDGASAPNGWTCVSCSPVDKYYQKFLKGAVSFGNTGGSATHSHTAVVTIGGSALNTIQSLGASGIATATHTHTATHAIANGSNLPPYRDLLVLRSNSSGVPTELPAGAIALFDNSVPSGWTRYGAQDGLYIRGGPTAGTIGGSTQHTHVLTATLSGSSGGTSASTNGATATTALETHTHTAAGNSQAGSSEPPYREIILGKLDSAASVPQNIITYWDNPPPFSWTNMSSAGQPLYQTYTKPSATYGATGGALTHTHADSTITSAPPSETGTYRTGTGGSSGTHTHTITFANISTESNEPPFIEAIAAKQGALNTPPNAPAGLSQIRTSDSAEITVGGYSNGGQIRFEAEASDADNPDSLQLCVEVQPVGVSFSGAPSVCGTSVAYNSTPVTVVATLSGLSDAISYHWQASTKDSGGALSAWASYGANLETEADFTNDSSAPTGIVYDGTTAGIDIDFNGGSISQLSANWDITDTGSGIEHFEYSISTVAGGDNILAWSVPIMATSQTVNSLLLGTSEAYYFNVRAFDAAGNNVVLSSDGQFVSPTISFAISNQFLQLNNLNASNNYTDTKNVILTTTTNARNGYEVRAYTPQVLASAADSIGMYSGGSYAAPSEWQAGEFGYGYTTDDPLVAGVNRFLPAVCLGGGLPPCYTPFALSAPGDIVVDTVGPITGTAITNQQYTVTHRVSAQPGAKAGTYQTTIIYSATVKY